MVAVSWAVLILSLNGFCLTSDCLCVTLGVTLGTRGDGGGVRDGLE